MAGLYTSAFFLRETILPMYFLLRPFCLETFLPYSIDDLGKKSWKDNDGGERRNSKAKMAKKATNGKQGKKN